MRAADTHCHLQSDKFESDREEVLARSLELLEFIVLIGDDLDSSRRIVPLLRERVYGVAGIHPYHAEHATPEALSELESLLGIEGFVALGEIGLDYFNEFAPRPAQVRAFRLQLELAARLGMPIAIHNREADDDTFSILSEFMPARLPGCIMHCFGSGPDFARRCVGIGCHVSFAGNVTFPKAQLLRDAAAVVPLDRLLVETDAPYLAPVPLRGKRCEPHFVLHTAAFLAGHLGVPPEEFAQQTTANARAVYRL